MESTEPPPRLHFAVGPSSGGGPDFLRQLLTNSGFGFRFCFCFVCRIVVVVSFVF